MTDLCSTPATSNESDCFRPPRSRRRLLLKSMPDGTPSRDAESEATWSVRNVNGRLNESGDDATAEEEVSTEALDYFTPAFRAVLREEAPTTKASTDTGSEGKECEVDEGPASLAYFAPALP